jgi:hypothetical protein
MPDGIPDHASAILSAGHLETRLVGRDEDDGTGDFLRSPYPPASGAISPCLEIYGFPYGAD